MAGSLTVLTALDRMPPPVLLIFTFLLGAGQALTLPTWQAVIPEVVPRAELAAASALGAVNTNLARSAGPAVAGLLVAHVGVAAVFGLNALSLVIFAVALTATYCVPAANRAAFVAAMQAVRRSRQRTGAIRWGLFCPGEHNGEFVEVYLVPTGEEHLRASTTAGSPAATSRRRSRPGTGRGDRRP